MKPDVCVFHGPSCADGNVAAWAVWRRWPDVAFWSGAHGDEMPNFEGKRVLIVDFSYPEAELRRAIDAGVRSITILDHHKTAEEDLRPFRTDTIVGFQTLEEQKTPPIQALFDMDQSGAALAWRYAHPGTQIPRLVAHVQDRDLWRFQLANTRQVHAVLMSYEFSFASTDELHHRINLDPYAVAEEGNALMRDRQRLLRDILAATSRSMRLGGYDVPVANLPHMFASDAGNFLAEGYPFAATYFDAEDGSRRFSLRRRSGTVDVSAIAKAYGLKFGTNGGGHAAAAGFQAPAGWEGDLHVGNLQGIPIMADGPKIKVGS